MMSPRAGSFLDRVARWWVIILTIFVEDHYSWYIHHTPYTNDMALTFSENTIWNTCIVFGESTYQTSKLWALKSQRRRLISFKDVPAKNWNAQGRAHVRPLGNISNDFCNKPWDGATLSRELLGDGTYPISNLWT